LAKESSLILTAKGRKSCAAQWSIVTVIQSTAVYRQPEIPRELQVPAEAQLILSARASGVQIYVCQQSAEGRMHWTLKGPEATLYDDQGRAIAEHYAGPTWKHLDGSEVTARAVARFNVPNGTAIPWLLLSATGHAGSGLLSRVTTIQRVQTVGGQPPAEGCNLAARGTEVRSEYEAEYYFYAVN
jgi:hypothetical protein